MDANAERTFFVAGQVHALVSFALALARTHPDRELLLRAFEKSSQEGLAKAEIALTSEQVIVGFQDTAAKILQVLGEKSLEVPKRRS